MTRNDLLHLAYHRENLLHLTSGLYTQCVEALTEQLLDDDLGTMGDVTTQVVFSRDRNVSGRMVAKQVGVIAGIEETVWFYKQRDIMFIPLVLDGQLVDFGQVIGNVQGGIFEILQTERVVLNLLQRMSGIATLTHQLVTRCAPLTVAATRKTPWGNMDNKAVSVGGGATHRLGLWESILIKDNHLQELVNEGVADPILVALQRSWKKKNIPVFIEMEVDTRTDAIHAAECFATLQRGTVKKPCIVMLDNFSAVNAGKTVRELKKRNLLGGVLLEASGGITPDNILEYRDSGVDVVSLGFLTHSPQALDISLEIEKGH